MTVDAAPDDGLLISDISKRFGNLVAVDGLSLQVPRGSLIGFLGPNGAGKTTTMRAVVGMVRLDSGEIRWDGQAIDDSVLTRIGYMPQERGVYARMKVREQVIYFARLAGLGKAAAADRTDFWLDQVGLSDRGNSLVQELSGGNQQRVQLAVSLVHDPELLILDEPFAGLDPIAAETMRDIIFSRAEAGMSVLFSSHQLDLVEDLCEHVVIIAEGQEVATGAIADLRSASPSRRLRVRWHESLEQWQPLEGTVRSFDGSSAVVDLPSSADFGANIAHAVAAGSVSEVGIEPPRLDEVFAELVSGAPHAVPTANEGVQP
ncbi:MAG: ABC transporter ATP-binding protein [Acidimicrobiales bacterium]